MEHPPRLFLGNILWNTTQNQIQQVLDKYHVGKGVQNIHIPRKGNVIDGKQHTIAFVTYEEKGQVEEAVALLHDRILEGVSTYPVSAMHARSRFEGTKYPPNGARRQDPGHQGGVPLQQPRACQQGLGQPSQAFQQGLGQPSQAFQQTGWAQQPGQAFQQTGWAQQPGQHGFLQPGHSLFGGLFQSGGHGLQSAQQMHQGAAFEPMMVVGEHVPGHLGAHQVHHAAVPPWRNPPGATSKAKSVLSPKPKPSSLVTSVDENEQAAQENNWYRMQDQAEADATSETEAPTSPIEKKKKNSPAGYL